MRGLAGQLVRNNMQLILAP